MAHCRVAILFAGLLHTFHGLNVQYQCFDLVKVASRVFQSIHRVVEVNKEVVWDLHLQFREVQAAGQALAIELAAGEDEVPELNGSCRWLDWAQIFPVDLVVVSDQWFCGQANDFVA